MPKSNHHNRSPITKADDFDLSFKVFHELMAKRVSEILLVSSLYDAFIMEEDGRLAERIIHEYRGLNLTRPPRFTWVSSAREAFNALSEKSFDLVITMPRLGDADPYELGRKIKEKFQSIPVVLLVHDTRQLLYDPEKPHLERAGIDKLFVWSGNTDLLLAIIKNVEDQMNVAKDTQMARVRVIILVEDSPEYRSSLLPLLYRELVLQTQAVMEESLNQEDRILRMRARPKIVVAENFEEAQSLYRQFKPYLLSVFSDVRFQRNKKIDDGAGFALLEMIKNESLGMPLLVFSSEEANRERALEIPAVFLNKNSPTLHTDIRSFLIQYLAFGDFVFKLPDGRKIARVANLRSLEKIIPTIPDESLAFHAERNHFSTWLMARSEIQLASILRAVKPANFSNMGEVKDYLVTCLKRRRKGRQKGIVTDFVKTGFDPDTDFFKIGKGSLGGKARGLAFASIMLRRNLGFIESFSHIDIHVPKTLVVSTEGFDSFMAENSLKDFSNSSMKDAEIKKLFLKADFPKWLRSDLEGFLAQINYPLAVRSSSLLEDAQFQPYAGIYQTYMIPNNSPDLSVRLNQLICAIKLVYASTFLEAPRSFGKTTLHRTEEEKMAVIIQQVTGSQYGNYFFPSVSGVAQSYNFYPISYMKPEEGIAHIALGLGKTVVEGGMALRFSPKYPQFLPQFSSVEDMLKNSQRRFFALDMDSFSAEPGRSKGERYDTALQLLEIDDMLNKTADIAQVKSLFSTYMPDDHKIRDSFFSNGQPVLSFASILKYSTFPLPEILSKILEMGQRGMGSPVEIEFAVNLPLKTVKNGEDAPRPEFALLQIRPMVLHKHNMDVKIAPEEAKDAFCFSQSAMGNGICSDISDIVFVNSDTFDSACTIEIAGQIGKINKRIADQGRKYLLVGPGRWGSADRWLGIPVAWHDISGIGAIIEISSDKLKADPSQGTHFFHNITSLGISYITVTQTGNDFIDEAWLSSLTIENQTSFVTHVTCKKPITIKTDGKTSRAVILK